MASRVSLTVRLGVRVVLVGNLLLVSVASVRRVSSALEMALR